MYVLQKKKKSLYLRSGSDRTQVHPLSLQSRAQESRWAPAPATPVSFSHSVTVCIDTCLSPASSPVSRSSLRLENLTTHCHQQLQSLWLSTVSVTDKRWILKKRRGERSDREQEGESSKNARVSVRLGERETDTWQWGRMRDITSYILYLYRH